MVNAFAAWLPSNSMYAVQTRENIMVSRVAVRLQEEAAKGDYSCVSCSGGTCVAIDSTLTRQRRMMAIVSKSSKMEHDKEFFLGPP